MGEEAIDEFCGGIERSLQEALENVTSISEVEQTAVEHWADHRDADEISKLQNIEQGSRIRWFNNFVRHEITDSERLL
eukprot:CAMPEP_0182443222 /NCGR_PEP_ID=MMETSP1172-20130603/2001_1 /TAXON_ID=708627 /ORGANISM="Timspurckia oligopyrenoides, Strain CCMP3278" /LENGTH=77 /DNA_ID=CAMNT_0024638415 /DNA_START=451 /DNA_END=684 /DNA_ORIENTATION=-